MTEARTILICREHPERPTPLIWTFAFMGCEYWCAHCGFAAGMLGAGDLVPDSPELQATLEADTVRSKEYLTAAATGTASKIKWEGEWIEPAKLPLEERRRRVAVMDAWKYPADAEGRA